MVATSVMAASMAERAKRPRMRWDVGMVMVLGEGAPAPGVFRCRHDVVAISPLEDNRPVSYPCRIRFRLFDLEETGPADA
jgi:hypothetical protein